MKHKRSGFTLIEVMLFLALTGMIFVGIVLGTQNSIYQQRFTDSVQGFAEFLRSVYAEVSNPQSAGDGRGDKAIYGKLIVFGEHFGLDGTEINKTEQRIYVYDVVGDANLTTVSGKAEDILKDAHANVVVEVYKEVGATKVVERIDPAGLVDVYTPRWNATIETTALNPYKAFRGSIMIIRHPKSGTINTLVSDEPVDVNNYIKEENERIGRGMPSGRIDEFFTAKIGQFGTREVDFCVDTESIELIGEGGLRDRRNIRLVENARNASGIEIIDMNDYDESDDGLRNKCMPKEV